MCSYSLILQLEDGTKHLLSKTIDDDGLEISIEGIEKLWTIDEYIQAWHN